MHDNGPSTVSELIDELNDDPDATFFEFARVIDVWASLASTTRKGLIDEICLKTGRRSDEERDSLRCGDTFVEALMVRFLPKGEA